MQHHPGSWYIPWNMGVPLQKMLTVPFNPSGQMTGAPGYPHHQPQIATAAIQHQQQQPPAQQQGPTSPNPQQTYQQQLTALQHHAALQHQPMHPAAAAMFTPLTLRSFVTHPHPGLHNLSQQQQQQLTNVQAGNGGTGVVNGTHHTSNHGQQNTQQNVPQTLSPNMANHHHTHAAAMLQHSQSHPHHHSHAQQTAGQQLTTMNINGLNVTGLQSATAAALRHHAAAQQHNNVLQAAGSLMSIPSMKKVIKHKNIYN